MIRLFYTVFATGSDPVFSVWFFGRFWRSPGRRLRLSWRHFGQYGTSLFTWQRLCKLIRDLGLPSLAQNQYSGAVAKFLGLRLLRYSRLGEENPCQIVLLEV